MNGRITPARGMKAMGNGAHLVDRLRGQRIETIEDLDGSRIQIGCGLSQQIKVEANSGQGLTGARM